MDTEIRDRHLAVEQRWRAYFVHLNITVPRAAV